jgi:DNA-binding MarR family transcriptional regulator
VSIALTKAGERLIEEVFPEFNQRETLAVSSLSVSEQNELARLLRLVLTRINTVTDEESA